MQRTCCINVTTRTAVSLFSGTVPSKASECREKPHLRNYRSTPSNSLRPTQLKLFEFKFCKLPRKESVKFIHSQSFGGLAGGKKSMGDTQSTTGVPDTKGMERKNKIKLSDEEWKAKLTPEQYSVCRNHGTERAWTGDLLENKGKGLYQCACCGANLFNSSTKFDSGSGWPSFFDVLKDTEEGLSAVDTHTDRSVGMTRTEVLCGKCDSHLGHVFPDGPRPTGLRYCINSASLKFKKDEEGSKKKDEL